MELVADCRPDICKIEYRSSTGCEVSLNASIQLIPCSGSVNLMGTGTVRRVNTPGKDFYGWLSEDNYNSIGGNKQPM